MEGLNNVLNELAKLLGVSKDALKSILDTVGANYNEVYSTLVREYAIKEVVHSLWMASSIGLIIFCAISGVSKMEDFKVSKFLKVSIVICIVTMVLTLFGPLFYPNINLIMGLLNK